MSKKTYISSIKTPNKILQKPEINSQNIRSSVMQELNELFKKRKMLEECD